MGVLEAEYGNRGSGDQINNTSNGCVNIAKDNGTTYNANTINFCEHDENI